MRNWLSIVFVGLGGLGMLAACGGDGTGGPPKGGSGGSSGSVLLDCSTLSNPPADCDTSCVSDSECAASYCENSTKCVANCTANEGCGAGSTCNTTRGRCVPDVGTGGTGGTGNSIGCQSVEVTPSRSIPNVMFLVDQSGSMTSNFAGQERWTAAHGAITEIVADLDSIVRFGLSTYTSDNGNSNLPCPRLPVAGDPFAVSPRVDFDLNNSSAISNNNIYPSNYPNNAGGDTPTGDSIDALVSIIQSDPPPAEGPTIIVLATDGEPDTCEQPNPQNGQAEAVAAATASHAAGLDVFILSVGNEVSDAHLQEMANVGVGKPANESGNPAPFWKATTAELLAEAFQQIISDSISCEIEIDKPFNTDTLAQACDEGEVRLNGVLLDCPTDWQVKNEPPYQTIELLGNACDTLKGGEVTFTAEFPCGTIVVE